MNRLPKTIQNPLMFLVIMIQVYTSADRLLVYHLKNILENERIATFLKNERLTSAIGDIPAIECWLEIWILDHSQQEQAKAIVRQHGSPQMQIVGGEWTCPDCSEIHESQFTDCWQCGYSRL